VYVASSDRIVLDYIYRRSAETGEVQEPITAISLATGFSTATVWRALNRLEEKGAIKIEKSDDQREAQRIIPLNRSDETNKVFDYWLTQSEDLVKLSHEILKGFQVLREANQELQARLEAYQRAEERVLSAIPFGEGYEIVIRRTSDTPTTPNEAAVAQALAQALTFQHQKVTDNKAETDNE
jgi:predicted transcriptional regulator